MLLGGSLCYAKLNSYWHVEIALYLLCKHESINLLSFGKKANELAYFPKCQPIHLQPFVTLQKRAVRIIYKVGPREHTNRPFIRSGLPKLKDNEHRKKIPFKHQFARTTLKQICISVVGVKLWNSLQIDLKGCVNIFFQFKKM